MNFTSFIYIFALAVLCSPGFFIKYKTAHYLLYSFVFTMVLYITFDFVNKYTENYEQYNVDVKGVDSLVDLIKTQGGDEKKIDINNQLFQEASANDANCWNALGKNQKELEIIKIQLDSYAGSKESVDKLNNQLETQKQEMEKLQDGLKGFEGTKTEIDQINIQIKNYQGEIDKLKQQLVLYNQTETTVGEINNQISKIQSTITDLNTKISECNSLNSEKETTITTLTGNVSEQASTITSLERQKTDLTNNIVSQNESINSLTSRKTNLTTNIPSQTTTISSLESKINNKEGCVVMAAHCNLNGWNKFYREGDYSEAPRGISSIKIPSGVKLTIYHGRSYSSSSQTWQGPKTINCLTDETFKIKYKYKSWWRTYYEYKTYKWNDNIGSFKIKRV